MYFARKLNIFKLHFYNFQQLQQHHTTSPYRNLDMIEGVVFLLVVNVPDWRNLGANGSRNRTQNGSFPARSILF